MRDDFDVVVVGARVAGASTALLLGRLGHRVLLVDRVRQPADTVSTHALLRTGVLQLKRWGILQDLEAAGTPEVTDITLGFGDDRIQFRLRSEFGIDHLIAPRRHLLDSTLVDASLDAGVELADGSAVIEVTHDENGTVGGVILEGGGGVTVPVTAGMVIGADGVRSRVARLVGAGLVTELAPTNAVHYAYYEGVPANGYWFQFTPGVNVGIVTTNDGLACVFAGRPAKRMGRWRQGPEAEFDRLIRHGGADLADVVAEGRRVTPFRGTTGLPGLIRRAWGPGWALVGDAGYTMDPISAHGISTALRDAELCARAVDRALVDPASATDAMSEYETVRDRLSATLFEESVHLAGFGWDAAEASQHMRGISDAVREECRMIDRLPAWPRGSFRMQGVTHPLRPALGMAVNE